MITVHEPFDREYVSNLWATDWSTDSTYDGWPTGSVARTLDVAEATADKARAVGLAREPAS